MADTGSMRSPLLGLRVRHCRTGQPAFVVGRAQCTGIRHALVPVTLEGSTRTELWPESWIVVRPTAEQFAANGGQFTAPAGYPLRLS
jgi:hypothetical protein